MYAMCASETSSCRLLPLPLRGDDDGANTAGDVNAARKDEDERRRNRRRVTEVKTARMAVRVAAVLVSSV
jgi:hypothetical protein